MREIKLEPEARTWYTFEFKDKAYIMTCAEWINGKMVIHGVDKDGHVLAIETQYGLAFTGSVDSIDAWMMRTT